MGKENKRIEAITRSLRHQLEDIIVKLNETSPQQLHDDIVPLLEDLEILELAVENKVEEAQREVPPPLSNEIVINTDEWVRPSVVFYDAHECIVRILQLIEIMEPKNEVLLGQAEEMRAIIRVLLTLDLQGIDNMHTENEEDKDE